MKLTEKEQAEYDVFKKNLELFVDYLNEDMKKYNFETEEQYDDMVDIALLEYIKNHDISLDWYYIDDSLGVSMLENIRKNQKIYPERYYKNGDEIWYELSSHHNDDHSSCRTHSIYVNNNADACIKLRGHVSTIVISASGYYLFKQRVNDADIIPYFILDTIENDDTLQKLYQATDELNRNTLSAYHI
jgi:hypothetical protein